MILNTRNGRGDYLVIKRDAAAAFRSLVRMRCGDNASELDIKRIILAALSTATVANEEPVRSGTLKLVRVHFNHNPHAFLLTFILGGTPGKPQPSPDGLGRMVYLTSIRQLRDDEAGG